MNIRLAITFYRTKEISIAKVNLYFGYDLFIQPHYADEISQNYNTIYFRVGSFYHSNSVFTLDTHYCIDK